ncbi:cytochrome P450 [Pseudobacter ginsenosidimutans]|uniref:Cytochrome P450 n=1 Tax=Pseudobacter ginsenosidimutans TaxID=661488 RepID=A0A4Q7MYW0_9BACT|nr:cytochrome P450 [Pseudobacter ginsenosidimutans]QEC43075.1 cytochrome P450 [Pseudobacter ginsenosidimutans]RZS74430.1 cytochrome P450 [Pseudobacter ginsenosidimutans]
MSVPILSPAGILRLASVSSPIINISAGNRREFILCSPDAIRAVLLEEAQRVTRPSKIFYWRQLMESIREEGLPLALRSLKNDHVQSLDPGLPAASIYSSDGNHHTIDERKLNLAVLSLMLSGYGAPIPPASLELFMTASDRVEWYKSELNDNRTPGLPDRIFFAQAVTDQRQFALDMYKQIGRDLPAGLTDPELYSRFKEEVDSLIGIIHFSCKNISNAIGWIISNLAAFEDAFCRNYGQSSEKTDDPNSQTNGYLYAVILESLRLFPPNWLFHRTAMNNFSLCGHHFIAGDLLHISPLLTHRVPECWEFPDTYQPARFMAGGKVDPWAFIPFGRSFTKCPGTNLSFRIIRAFVEKILSENIVSGRGHFVPVLRNTISLNPFPLHNVLLEKRSALVPA